MKGATFRTAAPRGTSNLKTRAVVIKHVTVFGLRGPRQAKLL